MLGFINEYRFYIVVISIVIPYLFVAKIQIHKIVIEQLKIYRKKEKGKEKISKKQLFFFYIYPLLVVFLIKPLFIFNHLFFKEIFTSFLIVITILVTFFSLEQSEGKIKRLAKEIIITVSYCLFLSLIILSISGAAILFKKYDKLGIFILYLITHLIFNLLMLIKRIFTYAINDKR